MLFHMVSLQKLRLFVFFLLLLHESYMVSLHKRISAEAACHIPYRIFRTHFFDAAKKTSSERDYIWYPHTSGSLEEAACHVPYRIFGTHVFDVAKKTSSEQNYIWYAYTSRSKKPYEKLVIFWNCIPEGREEWDGMEWDRM